MLVPRVTNPTKTCTDPRDGAHMRPHKTHIHTISRTSTRTPCAHTINHIQKLRCFLRNVSECVWVAVLWVFFFSANVMLKSTSGLSCNGLVGKGN